MPNSSFSLNKLATFKTTDFPERPTLVFLHDSLGCIALWRDFPVLLGNLTRCNVLVYDRQGYGKSKPFDSIERTNDYMEIEADVLNDVLEENKIEKAILFGHSDGGSIALISAAKYPEKILGIITEGAHVFVETVTINGIKEAIIAYETTNLKQKLEKYHGNNTNDLFWAWAKTWTTPTFADWNIEHFLSQISCPALVIQGEEDEFGTLLQVDKIVNQVNGNVEKLVIPNVKHTPHKEVPELILEESKRFIEKIINN
jgi:pimeloyl-ACP methyl ester carboxylesterase